MTSLHQMIKMIIHYWLDRTMSPGELRSLRERLGLSRRELAPKLGVSEPTLFRWERGQGAPKEHHLRMLDRLREHAEAGRSLTYFQYDAIGDLPSHGDMARQTIIEVIESIGGRLSGQDDSEDKTTSSLSFHTGWEAGPSVRAALVCEGSYRPERPSIDFALHVECESATLRSAVEELEGVCRDHRLCYEPLLGRGDESRLRLHHRLFDTACNRETIVHLMGNLRSCWERMKGCLCEEGIPETRGKHGGRETARQLI